MCNLHWTCAKLKCCALSCALSGCIYYWCIYVCTPIILHSLILNCAREKNIYIRTNTCTFRIIIHVITNGTKQKGVTSPIKKLIFFFDFIMILYQYYKTVIFAIYSEILYYSSSFGMVLFGYGSFLKFSLRLGNGNKCSPVCRDRLLPFWYLKKGSYRRI